MTALFRIAVAFLVCLACGAIPGSTIVSLASTRPVIFAPPVPESYGPRDARLDVIVKGPDAQYVQNTIITAYVMIEGRAHFSARGETDSSGVARLLSLPRGEHYVVADKRGLARKSTMVVTEPGARRLNLVMEKEHLLTVALEDETHSPIAGAVVEVSAGDPVPVGETTGDDGNARVARLGEGPFVVRVYAQGFEVVTRDHVVEGETCRITLARLAAIVVTVVDAQDVPVPRARVTIASATLYPPRAAETDAQGRVRIGGLSAGSYALRATEGAFVSPTELSLSLARAEEKNVTLKLGAGAMTEVFVVDAETDDAILGARVTLAEGGLSPFPLEAVTGKDGRAVIGPYASGRAVITVRAEEYVAKSGLTTTDDNAPLHVRLGKGGVIEGRVVDGRGFPIDGATFVIVGTDENGGPIDDDPRARAFTAAHFSASLAGPAPLVPAGELGVMPGPVPPIPHGGASLFPVAQGGPAQSVAEGEPWVSARDGTFTLAPITPGRVRVIARHPEFTDVLGDVIAILPGQKAKIDVVMTRGGSLEGRVVDSRGASVAGAEVTVAATHGSMERNAKTASDGTFAFASLPESVTVLVALADDPGEPLARAVVDVKEDARATVTLTLPEPRDPLAVRVVDRRGHGVAGAIVTAASIDEAQALHATAFADGDGSTTIPRASNLALRLDVRAPGFATTRVSIDARKDALNIELAPAVVVTGVVETDRGEPLAASEITAYGELGATHTVSDKDGAFHFSELGEGQLRVTARAPGRAPQEVFAQVAARTGARPFVLPKIALAEESVAEGVVVDETGKPVAGARVAKDAVYTYLAVGSSSSRGTGSAMSTTRDGHFRIGELPAGDVTLEALAPDVGRGRITIHVDAGRTFRDARIVVTRTDDESAHEHAAGGVAVTLGETGEPVVVVIVAVAESSEAERAGISSPTTSS